MPFGVTTREYAGILAAALGSTTLGAFLVHLYLRPDQNPPNMNPYIEAQRELIKKVQQRKREQEAATVGGAAEDSTSTATIGTATSPTTDDSNNSRTPSPVIKTQYGEFRQDELDAKTGLPTTMRHSTQSKNIPRFWMYLPIPQESVKDLVDGPYIEIPEGFDEREA